MGDDGAAPLREVWYYALPGHRLKRGAMLAKTLLGEPVLIGRDAAGAPFALRDLCPHRGVPLSCGRFDGQEVECCYHGWRFATDGRCTAIPSLVDGQVIDTAKIRTAAYPAREVQGNIWIYFGVNPARAPAIPVVPDIGERGYAMVETVRFPGTVDHAVVGLMDPAHGPFVHQSWWWRSRRSIHEKTKAFAPSPWGFTMTRHAPSSNSRAYRLLGGAPQTEIVFRLPGIRIEHIPTPAAAPLRAQVPPPGSRHRRPAAARLAPCATPPPHQRCRQPGEMVLPAEAGIRAGARRRPRLRQPDQAAGAALAELRDAPGFAGALALTHKRQVVRR